MSEKIVLQMKGITKEFSGVRVLHEVDFDLKKGEVHAIVGANGAGKSTLMKIMNGIFINYGGEILLNGEKIAPKNPSEAFDNGIAMIHQELDLVTNLEVSDNIFLGKEIRKNNSKIGVVDKVIMREESQKVLDSLGFPISSDELVETLSPAMQQLVLVARVVGLNTSVVVMDEPTSSLSINEIEKLFEVIKGLCERGISVIYISHFLEEIFRVADRVTVLRDGHKIKTENVKDCTQKQLVEWMVGHKETGKTYHRDVESEEVVLSVKEFTQKKGIVKDVSFDLKKGEVLGIAGVVGSGRSELAKMIFGAEAKAAGEMALHGEQVDIKHPVKAVKMGIGFVPEDRKIEGLVLIRTIEQNIYLPIFHKLKGKVINFLKLKKISDGMIKDLGIKCHSPEQEVQYLSGGNQQKVVIGKWLSADTNILLLDQPTRGVDIGAKEEIYELVHNLAIKGTSIIFISDEIEEILSLADRILVMKKGEIVGEFENYERKLTKVDLLTSMVSDEETCGKVVI